MGSIQTAQERPARQSSGLCVLEGKWNKRRAGGREGRARASQARLGGLLFARKSLGEFVRGQRLLLSRN